MTGKHTFVKVDCTGLFPHIIQRNNVSKNLKFTQSRYLCML